MSRIVCSSEVDTTYNENSDLPYLFNVTVFDYRVMRWMAVARVRSNKENVHFYDIGSFHVKSTQKNIHHL